MQRPSAWDGARELFRGVAFVYTTPGVRRYAFVPLLVAGGLFVALAIGGVLAAIALGDRHGGGGLLGVLLVLALCLAAILLAFVASTALAQPLSSFALDRIVRAQECALGVSPPQDDPGGSFFRSLRVTMAALAVALPVIGGLTLLSALAPPVMVVTVPLKILVTAALLTWDFVDYPLGMRGLGVRQRLAWMRANTAAVFGFGATATAMLLVPGVGLLVLPAAVAGATRMVAATRLP